MQRRVQLQEDPSLPRSAKDRILEGEDVDYFRKRFKDKQKIRQKAKSNVDKRIKLRDEEKIILSGIEDKKENFVYKEGSSYSVRWSSLPRLFYERFSFLIKYHRIKLFGK